MGDAFGAGIVEHLSHDDLMSMDFMQHEDAVPLEPYERYTPKNEEANMMCKPVMLPSGRLTSKNDENGSYLQS